MSCRASYRPYYEGNRRSARIEAPTYALLENVEQVLLKLKDTIDKNGKATVADFYSATGGLVVDGDENFGWKDLLDCRIEYSRYGYQLYMPTPYCLEDNPIREVYNMLMNCGEEDAYDTVIEARRQLSEAL